MAISRGDIVKMEHRARILTGFSVKVDAGDAKAELQFSRDVKEDGRLWDVTAVVPLPWGPSAVRVPFMTYVSDQKVEDVATIGMQLLVQYFVQAANDLNAMSYEMTKAMQ